MQIIFKYEGVMYTGKKTGLDKAKAADQMYDVIGNANRFSMELENGNVMVIGEKALQSGVFIFKD